MKRVPVYFFVLLNLIIISGKGFTQGLVINELMSSNQNFIYDSDGDTPDWFELYNGSDGPIDLGAYVINDKFSPASGWQFPSYILEKGKYLMLFASGKNRKEKPLYWSTIINQGDNWRYLLPVTEPSAEWKSIQFNDSNWKEGKSGFGYGDNDDNTLIPINTLTVYLRKTFSISNAGDIKKALLHIDYDDGFVAYLNGTEIARGNMAATGVPAYNSSALNTSHEAIMVNGGLPEEFDIKNFQSLLVNGTNVLAIQVHNGSNNSTDMSAIPFLSLGSTSPLSGEPASFIKVSEEKFHTGFNLSSEGEGLFLFKDGLLVDSVFFPALRANLSWGRNENGDKKWYFYNQPTPEKSNTSKPYSSISGEVRFSVAGGIFQQPFTVELSSDHPGDKIYYTTDQTEPTISDRLYTGPINIASTTLLRATVINENALPGFVETQSYLFNIKHDLPVISLVSDPDNFFGYENGIYATGSPKPSSGENCDNGANYWQDWEVPVHVSMIETDGKLAFGQNAGIKIFGGCSRNNAQKSLSLRFREQYGKEGLNYKVFDDLDLEKFYSLNLRSSGNDWNNTMFRDGLNTHLFPESVDKTAFRPSVVYINGEYWGIHNIRERIDENYVATHYQLNPDSVNIMEFHVNWLLNVVEGNGQHYLDLIDFIEKNDLSKAENYDYVKTQMDVENFALYQGANICLKNTDWPGNNVKFWQSFESDARWRWITFDTDFGFSDAYHNTLTFALFEYGTAWPNPAQSTYLLRQLNKNQSFRHLFINGFADMLNTLWVSSVVRAQIDKMRNEISSEIPRHFARWGANTGAWAGNVNSLYTFASQRPAVVRKFVQDYYGLTGTYNLTLLVSDKSHGTIRLNTIEPKSYPWSGLYFNQVPITLTARPNLGYRFVRWAGVVNSTDVTISITRSQTASLKAIFEKDDSYAGEIFINELFYAKTEGDTPNDWIELFNSGNETIDLSDWILKDSDDKHQFKFPQGTLIESNDFLVVCGNNALFKTFYGIDKKSLGDLGFGFSNRSDCVRLFDKNLNLIDSLSYTNPNPDRVKEFSYQLFDLTDEPKWEEIAGFGTPLAQNLRSASIDHREREMDLVVYPNPFFNRLTIMFELESRGRVSVELISSQGTKIQLAGNKEYEMGQNVIEWDGGSRLAKGVYLLVVRSDKYSLTRKIVRN